jgi:ubiquitin carboxyl-terminal hydrolase 8
MPVRGKKPDFPLTTSITPDTLRSYFLNLSVDVLILDVRPETEFWRGYVGHQYVERDCKINVVWIDPTILMRDG